MATSGFSARQSGKICLSRNLILLWGQDRIISDIVSAAIHFLEDAVAAHTGGRLWTAVIAS